MMAIVSRASGKRFGNGWARALFGVLIVGALVASLALVQRGIPRFAPPDIEQPLPPLAPKVEQVYRGPIFVEPVPVRVVQKNTANEAAINTDTAKSRTRLTSVTHTAKRKSTQDQMAEPDPEATSLRVETCDGMAGMDLARCMRPQILDADLRLRTAYTDAAKAGVKRRELVSYRRQWSKLRKRANSDPRRVLLGFHEITRQLDVARAALHPVDSECGLSNNVCAVPNDQ